MTKLVVRHGLSEANNRNNIGTLAFASLTAPLMDLGREQSHELATTLVSKYGIQVATTAVAVSELNRTQETAQEAGFRIISIYPLLNEVVHGMDLEELRTNLANKQLPRAALDAAHAILEAPPVESVWITHGLVFAGLCEVLGVCSDQRFIPKFCEVRKLPI